jgi:pilus assembly protein Flp/PilA
MPLANGLLLRALLGEPPSEPAVERHTGKGCALMRQIRRTLTSLRINVRGVTALEYAMIASLIAVVCVTAVGGLGGQLSRMFSNIGNAVP